MAVQNVDISYQPGHPSPTAPQTHLVAVTVALTNTAATPQVFLELTLQVEDGNGHQYMPTPFSTLQPGAPVKPGQQVRGTVIFDIPNTASHLTLTYQPNATNPAIKAALS